VQLFEKPGTTDDVLKKQGFATTTVPAHMMGSIAGCHEPLGRLYTFCQLHIR
jgi:hypothetical protein